MASLKKLKIQFLEYMEIEKGRAIRTIENYDHYLTRFLNFLKTDDPSDITDDKMREFRLWLNRQETGNRSQSETLSKKTQNYYLISIRAFMKYLTRQGIKSYPAERIELAKTSQRMLDLITKEELIRLLNAPSGDDVKSLRDKAILELLFSTGLRVSELCALRDDVNLKSSELAVRGKGGKVRVVFISDDARAAVEKYLKKREGMSEALFTRIGREKTGSDFLDRRSVERIVKHYATVAGIAKRVTPHVMRHMFATDLLGNGADIRSVQTLLGHSSIITTQIYTHITDKHLHDIHKKFHNKK